MSTSTERNAQHLYAYFLMCCIPSTHADSRKVKSFGFSEKGSTTRSSIFSDITLVADSQRSKGKQEDEASDELLSLANVPVKAKPAPWFLHWFWRKKTLILNRDSLTLRNTSAGLELFRRLTLASSLLPELGMHNLESQGRHSF